MPRPRILLPLLTALVLSLTPALAAAATSGSRAFESQAQLLITRVGEISAQTPAGSFPKGTGSEDGELRLVAGNDWTSGFLAGSLWRVADLTGSADDRERALAATVAHFGFEQTRLLDLGFMYGESSVAGFERLCRGASPPAVCRQLKKSGVTAAETLLKLAQTTGQRIIPLSAKTCSHCNKGRTETIVDSMMNLQLFYWASRTTGRLRYRNLAKRHAEWVARHLVRRDGSTYQAAEYVRRAKRPRLSFHTHQGLRGNSVWSRGQAWSIYGFADAGREFRSKRFLAIAERNAAWVSKRLPASKLPPWDFNARGRNVPGDVSAGVIMASGLFHLAAACRSVKKGCRQPGRWAPLARKVLAGSLAGIRTENPVGFLGGQVYWYGRTDWESDAEMVYGLDYALEAVKLARASYPVR